jgi:hypothetical protein
VRQSWLNSRKQPPQPTRDAFTPRVNGADDDGLSAGLTPLAVKESLRKAGTVSLHVGRLRNIGLNVIRDPEDDTHALIYGVPRLTGESTPAEIDRFEVLMANLIEMARHRAPEH